MRLAIILMLCASSFAQTKPTFWQVVKQPDFILPNAFLVGSIAADGLLSNHWAGHRYPNGYICAYEGNSNFSTRNGEFNAGKFAAVNAPKLGLVVLAFAARKYAPQSKTARVLTALFSAGSGVPHAVSAIRWIRMCH